MPTYNRDTFSRALAVMAIIVAASTLLIGAFRTQPSPAASKTSALTEIKKSGVIRIAVVPAPPVSSIDPGSHQPKGYAIDVIEAIARNAGLKVEYHSVDWTTVSASIASGETDIAVGPVFNTEGRAKEFSFTNPLFAYAIVAVGTQDNARLQRYDDLFVAGVRVAVGRGGFDNEFVARNMSKAEVATFPGDNPSVPMLEVMAGRADVALVDFATAQTFVKENPTLSILFDARPVALQYAGFMTRQEWPLVEFFNVGLRNLELSGQLSTIDKKYQEQRGWYGRVNWSGGLVHP